eukprot:5472733-Lingulodinium_polyedra.AAC.1
MWAPPCSTFSSVRARKGSVGPRPVRTASGSGRYGLSDLYPSEKEDVRLGTLLALRACRGMKECIVADVPFIFETPWPKEGHPSITKLDEYLEVIGSGKVIEVKVDQCMYGAPTRKPTLLAGFGVDMQTLAAECDHPQKTGRPVYRRAVLRAASPADRQRMGARGRRPTAAATGPCAAPECAVFVARRGCVPRGAQ